MKHLPLGLFLGHLLFISGKSIVTPITFQELGLSALLLLTIFVPKALKVLHKAKFREFLIEKEKIELQRPEKPDPEIAELEKENRKTALRLNKFITEGEFKKREIARAVEAKVGDGGLRF